MNKIDKILYGLGDCTSSFKTRFINPLGLYLVMGFDLLMLGPFWIFYYLAWHSEYNTNRNFLRHVGNILAAICWIGVFMYFIPTGHWFCVVAFFAIVSICLLEGVLILEGDMYDDHKMKECRLFEGMKFSKMMKKKDNEIEITEVDV